MKSPLQSLIQMGVVPTVTFPANSRYYGSATLTYVTPAGQSIAYLAQRIVPQPGSPNFATVAQHVVRQGDRLDLIAAKYLGDPLIFWLICDANGAINPFALVETPGTVLDITTPQGVPGVPNAR
jgi:nucleoid-associated protein YgaU